MKKFIQLITLSILLLPFYEGISQESFPERGRVIKVIDGDAIEINTLGKVRLIGVDCPELADTRANFRHFAEKAKKFVETKALNKIVMIEYDSLGPKVDVYGRTLAYIYLEDGTFLNAEIIKNGYGFAYKKFPFKYFEDFRRYETKAMESKVGLWSDREIKESKIITPTQDEEKIIVYITKTGTKYHREGCRHLRRSSIPITLKEAKQRGYEPCKVCKPPF